MTHSHQNQWFRSRFARLAAVVGGSIVGVFALAAAIFGVASGWNHSGVQTPTEIFQGVVYRCELLPSTEEGGGLLHIVTIDLSTPGIEFYATPMDTAALQQGWQYRLRWISDVVKTENLSIAVNGAMFVPKHPSFPWLVGDFARGVETVVADHVISHIWEHNYLLSIDDQLMPTLDRSKPPTAATLAGAKWAVGGQGVWLRDGRVWPGADHHPDARTAVAIDSRRRLLFLAVGENVSPHRMLGALAAVGARDGMLLDGGHSSSMAIGTGASGVRPGVVSGGWRPVATYVGIRARPLVR